MAPSDLMIWNEAQPVAIAGMARQRTRQMLRAMLANLV